MKFKPHTDEEIEHMIAEVNGTMAVEGIPLTEEDKELYRKYLKGEYTFEDVKRIISEGLGK